MLVPCHSKPWQFSLKKPQIKHDFFKNEGVILEKLIQVNLELVFFCDFYFLPTGFRAWKAKNLLNLAREFCRNFVEQNLNENKSSEGATDRKMEGASIKEVIIEVEILVEGAVE